MEVHRDPEPTEHHRSSSPQCHCVSVRTDMSKGLPPTFGPEQKDESPIEPQESCSECEKSLVVQRLVCGHGLCADCSSSARYCPQCGKKLKLSDQFTFSDKPQAAFKRSLIGRCSSVSEGREEAECTSSLEKVYTELFITESLSEVTTPHELSQMEADSHKHIQETRIQSKDIFKPLPSEDQQEALQEPLRLVLTLGVAGVGKTFSVLKFSLDWAKGFENQDLFLVLPLSFRELNLATRGRYSLLELIHVFYPSLRPLSAQTLLHSKVLFILDGLDESRVPLDFSCEAISEVTQGSEVGPLLVNLIRGSLLPDALIWITSRPAAANQIPAECVQRLTEVRGFLTDQQREDYFCMRFSDGDHFRTVLSHIRSSRCIYTMCQIPVFCWITATVLDHMLRHPQSGALPQTLTDLYAHFLLVQTQRKRKYGAWSSVPEPSSADCDLLLKLGRLAFEHLQKGNIMFYQEDLEEVGLDLRQASLYSGLCPEIFKPQSVIFNQKVYSFVHFSVQEFMAAVYIHHCFSTKNTEVLSQFVGEDLAQSDVLVNSSLDMFLRRVMEVSLGSKTGHLDLFVRFLHGLSLESNRRALRFLLGPNKTDQETIQRVMDNLKELNLKDVSPDRSINIYHCLIEMHDQSVQQQIQDFLKTEGSEKRSLSEIQCSALAYMLQMSEQVLEELDLSKYNTSREGRWRLIPAVRNCKKAKLSGCSLTNDSCRLLAGALRQDPSHLRVLDLSENLELKDLGVMSLCWFLRNPQCKLETLSLKSCGVSDLSCVALARALSVHPSPPLRNLDLRDTAVTSAGLHKLRELQPGPGPHQLQVLSTVENSTAVLESGSNSPPQHWPIHCEGSLQTSSLTDDDSGKGSSIQSLCGREEIQSPTFSSRPEHLFSPLDLGSTRTIRNELFPVQGSSMQFQSLFGTEEIQSPTSLSWPEPLFRPLDLGSTRTIRNELFPETCASSSISPSVSKEPEPGPSQYREIHDFVPEVSLKSGHVCFRFRCPGSGAFRCSSTGLVFVVTKEAELQYKIVQWDEALLESSGRTPAGPLYDIECPEQAVCELHLPHCEPEHVDLSTVALSVGHISDSGLILMDPERITQSHVVISVSGLSLFGLLWKIFQGYKEISGQVLLFCTPQKLKVNVFLLPRNISVHQVEKKQRSTTLYIDAPSECKLVINQHYKVACLTAKKIQPERALFDMDNEPNFHPSFELRLPLDCGLVSISVKEGSRKDKKGKKGRKDSEVWSHEVDLTGASVGPEQHRDDPLVQLRSVRSEFVQSVSDEVLKQLLDKLQQEKVLSAEEVGCTRVKSREDKARYLLDTVLQKGHAATSVFIQAFCELDPRSDLCQRLRTEDS